MSEIQYSPNVDLVIYDNEPFDILDDPVEQRLLALAILDQSGMSYEMTQKVAVVIGIRTEWNNLPYIPVRNATDMEEDDE